jgi:hypothetical protein
MMLHSLLSIYKEKPACGHIFCFITLADRE